MAERSGHVLSVTETTPGATIASAAGSTDTVLYVDDVADFDESGGWLTISGATGIQYAATDDDAATIALSAVLGTTLAVGDVVSVWDNDRGVPAVDVVALVDLPEGTVPAVVPAVLAAQLQQSIRTGAAEAVTIQNPAGDPDSWQVTGTPGSAATDITISSRNGKATIDAGLVPSLSLTNVDGDEVHVAVLPSAGMQLNAANGVYVLADDLTTYLPLYAGTMWTNGTLVTSDRKLKTKFADPGDALAQLRNIPVYGYELKAVPGAPRVGVMADDVPEALRAARTDGTQAVDLYGLVALLLAGFHELDAQINPTASRKARNLK